MQGKKTTKIKNYNLSKQPNKKSIKLRNVLLGFVGLLTGMLAFLHLSVLSNSQISSSSSAAAAQEPTKESSPTKVQDNYHLVFSTSCSDFQNWQSYVLFYSALYIQQPGHVTRIASGCTDLEASALKKAFDKSIAPMSPSNKFHIHFSPEFRELGANNMSSNFQVTKYFNKPYGLLHWMEHEMGYNDKLMSDDKPSWKQDTIIILVDPDMILLRPITGDYTNDPSMIWEDPTVQKSGKGMKVKHGKPLGSKYGYGATPFREGKFDLKKIIPDLNSNVHKVNIRDGAMYYPAGPPYIATARDMYRITKMWTTVAPLVHEQSSEMMAEMYSYSIAAAHYDLRHYLSRSFMVSAPLETTNSEGWDMIEKIDSSEICHFDTRKQATPLPLVLHYCQRALLERWVITKYRLRKDFISCKAPLLQEPPVDLALKYDYGITPPKKKGDKEGEKINYTNPNVIKHHAFMLCQEIFTFNRASTYYKKHNCNGKGNFNKTYSAFPEPAW